MPASSSRPRMLLPLPLGSLRVRLDEDERRAERERLPQSHPRPDARGLGSGRDRPEQRLRPFGRRERRRADCDARPKPERGPQLEPWDGETGDHGNVCSTRTYVPLQKIRQTQFPVLLATLTAFLAFGSPGFSARVDNPWFPLRPGTVYVYRGVKDGKPARDVVTVTHRIKMIEGAPCVVVSDRLYLDGKLDERTTDWYSQDRARQRLVLRRGHGRARRARPRHEDRGHLAGRPWTARSAGIYMPAHPVPDRLGRQEYYKGHADDHFEVLSLDATVRVPYTSSQQSAAHEGVDAARAGRRRPQALRPRHRHRRSSRRSRAATSARNSSP